MHDYLSLNFFEPPIFTNGVSNILKCGSEIPNLRQKEIKKNYGKIESLYTFFSDIFDHKSKLTRSDVLNNQCTLVLPSPYFSEKKLRKRLLKGSLAEIF